MPIRFDDRVAIVPAPAPVRGCHALLLAERGAQMVVNDPGGTVMAPGRSTRGRHR